MPNQASKQAIHSSTNSYVLSESVEDIIAQSPDWAIRWGSAVLSGLVTLFLLGSWFIKYPEIVIGAFKLTSESAPKILNSKIDSRIEKIWVKHNQIVEANQLLASFESTANTNEVIALSTILDTLFLQTKAGNFDGLLNFDRTDFGNLGEVQEAYRLFDQNTERMLSLYYNNFYEKKRQLIQNEINRLAQNTNKLNEQKVLYERDYEIASRDFDTQKQLLRKGYVSKNELRKYESQWIAKQLPLRQTESAILNIATQKGQKQNELIELEHTALAYRSDFLQSLNGLRSAIESWKKTYLIYAPVKGRLVFLGLWQEKQNVQREQMMFSIDNQNGKFVGLMAIKQQNFGKIKIHQKVLIKFNGYPYQEYGIVEGEVLRIAEITDKDDNYWVEVKMPNGLKTSQKKQLSYRNGMTATAEIVTQDVSLLQRLLYQFYKLF